MHDDRLAECLALFCVVERVFIGRTRNAKCLRTHGWARRFERLHCRLRFTGLAALTGTGQLGIQLFFAPEQAAPRHTHIVEHHFGGVARLDAVLQVLLTLRETLRAWRHDERRLPATLQFGVDGSDHNVHVGDAAVGDPCLRTVQHPLVFRFVIHRASA